MIIEQASKIIKQITNITLDSSWPSVSQSQPLVFSLFPHSYLSSRQRNPQWLFSEICQPFLSNFLNFSYLFSALAC